EVFQVSGQNILQLTRFGRSDTGAQTVSAGGQRALLVASSNVLGTNPSENCQLFSIDLFGRGLKQLTTFQEAPHAQIGCTFFPPPGCGNDQVTQDRANHTIVLNSSCSPFGTNPNGYEVFAVRPDGTGLRQLTTTSGYRTFPDGSIEVENPGPTAYVSVPPR